MAIRIDKEKLAKVLEPYWHPPFLTAILREHGGNPVIPLGAAGEWDESATCSGLGIVKVDGYRLYYVGIDAAGYHRLGFAESTDGLRFTKYAGNPVHDVGAGGYRMMSNVYYDPALTPSFYIYRADADDQVYLSTSDDGITWTDQGLVLPKGGAEEWDRDGVGAHFVIKHNGKYYMFYTGAWVETDINPRDRIFRLGVAISDDLFTWTKYEGNPVLPLSPDGLFDSEHIRDAIIIPVKELEGFLVLYAGWDGFTESDPDFGQSLGFAFSRDLLHWTKIGEVKSPVLEGRTNTGYAIGDFGAYAEIAGRRHLYVGGSPVDKTRKVTACLLFLTLQYRARVPIIPSTL